MSVILPALDEEAALPLVLADLAEHLGPECEVIVVDDGSTDDTYQVARASEARVARHETNRGKGAAMATGADLAEGNLLVFMDADATYPAAAIPQLVEMLADFDIVRGERPIESPNIPTVNRVGNRVFNRLLSSFHQLEGHDIMSGLYGMTRAAFDALKLESSGSTSRSRSGSRPNSEVFPWASLTSTTTPGSETRSSGRSGMGSTS